MDEPSTATTTVVGTRYKYRAVAPTVPPLPIIPTFEENGRFPPVTSCYRTFINNQQPTNCGCDEGVQYVRTHDDALSAAASSSTEYSSKPKLFLRRGVRVKSMIHCDY
jgi:hypothetical protein